MRSDENPAEARFDDAPENLGQDHPILASMLGRGSCRSFEDRAVPMELLQVLCAAAMASPTKSDLQQRDIITVQSEAQRVALARLIAEQAWTANVPTFVVFCGNNRRQRLLHDWRDVAFANDHLDAFFNATTDAAVALSAFVTAAEATGLGCCPISAVRNRAQAVSDLLGLPDHVFPLAGLAVGYPLERPAISKRLPLSVTCHLDRYQEDGLQASVARYDAKRSYETQRLVGTFGESSAYGWSEDKVRQYSQPERAEFGAFVRGKGFLLE